MSAQPPQEPQETSHDAAPPARQDAAGDRPATGSTAAEHHGHAGPWILAAAVVLVLGVLGAVVIHDANTSDTQTVVTRSPTVNSTTVQRSAPTVTQATTNVAPATTVTAPTQTKTVTVTQPKTTTAPATTTP